MSTHKDFLSDSTQVALLHTSRIRPVFCVIEHAYRNRQIADDACAGIFTSTGLTIDLGTEIDWESPRLPVDPEWAIEWYKFYYGLDLAHAFKSTREEIYLSTWRSLVRSWIKQRRVNSDSSDVVARRITNWIYAWNIFARESYSDAFEDELIASIRSQTKYLYLNLTAERNHRTLELYALLIVALAIPEIDEELGLLDFATHNLFENLLSDVLPDGVHREQSTHYHMTALRSFLGARENARLFGFDFPNGYDERLLKACEFALHVHRPDGLIPALSDSDTGSYFDLLQLAADLFDREDFRYVATQGLQGTAPTTTCSSFSDGGYYIQRSGWSNSENFQAERYLVFDCGPLGDGGHGHYDLLNVEIYANGKPLIVDPGRFTYFAEGDAKLRRAFKGTAAHNTVCVDGLDQTAFYPGKPKQSAAKGKLLSRLTRACFDMLCGEVISNCYDALHTRRIFFVANEYWVIVDNLRSDQKRTFDLRFHLTPEAWNHTAMCVSETNVTVRTPDVALVFDSTFQPRIEPGWVSPKYGVKHLAPVVSVKSENTATDFVSLIYPTKLHETAPSFRVISDAANLRDSGVLEVVTSCGVEYIEWETG
ncbi:MAG TPA: alginate lyase family protein [Pyrinomonadaceae bacterium]